MSYRRSKKKREKGLIWVFVVVALLAAFLLYQTSVLKKRQAAYAGREQELEEQIAREKLGLGYPGEIVVEPEK